MNTQPAQTQTAAPLAVSQPLTISQPLTLAVPASALQGMKTLRPAPLARARRSALPVSIALDAFLELAGRWGFQAASCHNGGFHRLSVTNTTSAAPAVLLPWVIRPSAKTGDCWVRLMDAQGRAVGRDRCFPDLSQAKAHVESEFARRCHALAQKNLSLDGRALLAAPPRRLLALTA